MEQNFLEKIINYFNEDEASNIVTSINSKLLKMQDDGLINDQERDALRHYLGIQGLAEKYGDTVAWLAGFIHEGTDLVIPGEAGIQSQVDRQNNNIALEHITEGLNINIEDLNNYENLQNLLSMLIIPPPYGEISTPPPEPKFNPETYNTGYHPELDNG